MLKYKDDFKYCLKSIFDLVADFSLIVVLFEFLIGFQTNTIITIGIAMKIKT